MCHMLSHVICIPGTVFVHSYQGTHYTLVLTPFFCLRDFTRLPALVARTASVVYLVLYLYYSMNISNRLQLYSVLEYCSMHNMHALCTRYYYQYKYLVLPIAEI